MSDLAASASVAGSTPAGSVLAQEPETVLVSAMRNEAPFILEWVAYHKRIGFSRIVVFSNASTDGTEDILAALAEAGEITHHRVTPRAHYSPQMAAAKAFEKREGYRDGSWYLWLDADEFLNIHVGSGRVADLIAATGTHCGINLNWRIFGTSGHERFPGRFISGHFPGASSLRFGANRETKTLFRKTPDIAGFADNAVYRPRLAEGHTLTAESFLAGNGKPMLPDTDVTQKWLSGITPVRTNIVSLKEAGWALAQINHYSVRTPEFFALKKVRGRGAAKLRLKTNSRHDQAYFDKFNMNGESDLSIAVWEQAVTSEMDRLLAHHPVARASEIATQSIAQQLGQLAESVPMVGLKAPQLATATAPDHPRVVLVSAMRNEAPFLLEWVAYHKVIGIDEIVVCSNPSDDGTDELLAALDGAGVIRHLRTSPARGIAPQAAAVAAFEAEIGYRSGDWYLWLDADEFLNVHTGDGTARALVSALGDASGILLNWRLFGSNGNATFPGRFVSPAFDRASEARLAANLETKSLFRAGPLVAGFAPDAISRPRLVPNGGARAEDFLAGNGSPLRPTEPKSGEWLAGRPVPGRTNIVSRPEFGWHLAQINHYSVRTPDFFRLKATRGRGAAATGPKRPNARHTDSYFRRFDRNEAEDRSILRWQEPVTAEMDRLLQVPAISEASAAADQKVRQALLTGVQNLNSPVREREDAPEMDRPLANRAVTTADRHSDNPMSEMMPPPDTPATIGSLTDTASPAFKLTFPRAERKFVTAAYGKAQTILEYGSGGSTVLAAELGKPVITVESDKAWADRLASHLAGLSDTALVHHVDIGPTGAWGFPAKPNGYGSFHRYALSVWDHPDFVQPDLVLIDGRFRAACLAAVMLRTTKPVTVLFDDYALRRYYHGVERLAKKEELVGRMARFTVTPMPIPPDMMTEVIGWFADPR